MCLRLPRFAGPIGLFGLAAVLLSCGPNADSGPMLLIRIAPTPPTVGEARVIVQLAENAPSVTAVEVVGRPFEDSETVVLSAEPSGPNAYAVPRFPFSIGGEWRIVAVATTGAGDVLRDSTTVRVVGGFSTP